MVLFVLEAHRALYLCGGVDELAERVAGQRMIVAAVIDILEAAGLVEVALSIDAVEEEAFDLVGRVQGVAAGVVHLLGEALQHAAQIPSIRCPHSCR